LVVEGDADGGGDGEGGERVAGGEGGVGDAEVVGAGGEGGDLAGAVGGGFEEVDEGVVGGADELVVAGEPDFDGDAWEGEFVVGPPPPGVPGVLSVPRGWWVPLALRSWKRVAPRVAGREKPKSRVRSVLVSEVSSEVASKPGSAVPAGREPGAREKEVELMPKEADWGLSRPSSPVSSSPVRLPGRETRVSRGEPEVNIQEGMWRKYSPGARSVKR
jgi:hypothetical protein